MGAGAWEGVSRGYALVILLCFELFSLLAFPGARAPRFAFASILQAASLDAAFSQVSTYSSARFARVRPTRDSKEQLRYFSSRRGDVRGENRRGTHNLPSDKCGREKTVGLRFLSSTGYNAPTV